MRLKREAAASDAVLFAIAAQPKLITSLQAATRKNIVELEYEKLSLLPAGTDKVDLTSNISQAIDRDLGYLVSPRRTTKAAIFNSSKSHRRVLRDNPSDSFSIN